MCFVCQKSGRRPRTASSCTMNLVLPDTIVPPFRTIDAVMVLETCHPWHQEKKAATSGFFDQAERARNSLGEAMNGHPSGVPGGSRRGSLAHG